MHALMYKLAHFFISGAGACQCPGRRESAVGTVVAMVREGGVAAMGAMERVGAMSAVGRVARGYLEESHE
jgi:hypothetical protein